MARPVAILICVIFFGSSAIVLSRDPVLGDSLEKQSVSILTPAPDGSRTRQGPAAGIEPWARCGLWDQHDLALHAMV
jgi:hypothetical protein